MTPPSCPVSAKWAKESDSDRDCSRWDDPFPRTGCNLNCSPDRSRVERYREEDLRRPRTDFDKRGVRRGILPATSGRLLREGTDHGRAEAGRDVPVNGLRLFERAIEVLGLGARVAGEIGAARECRQFTGPAVSVECHVAAAGSGRRRECKGIQLPVAKTSAAPRGR